MLKFRLRKTILGNFQSLREILEFIVLPFVKLHHIGHIFFSFLIPPGLDSLLILHMPTWFSYLRVIGGWGAEVGGRKSSGHFAPSLTGGFGYLLSIWTSPTLLSVVLGRAPGSSRATAVATSQATSLEGLREGPWGSTVTALGPQVKHVPRTTSQPPIG